MRRAPSRGSAAEEAITTYCLRCLCPSELSDSRCPGCGASFWGAGGSDRVTGRPPGALAPRGLVSLIDPPDAEAA